MVLAAIIGLLLLQTVPVPPATKGSLEGTVIRAATNEPISEVTVLLITAVRETGREPTFSAKTDSSGRFIFAGLDPGDYRLGATASGYVRTEYGQRGSVGRGTPLHLDANQNLKNIVLPMTPTGTVSGRIRDEKGQPVAGVPVQLLSYSYDESGQRQLRPAGRDETTDDRGEFRLFFVTPGRYYLQAGRTAIGQLGRAPNQMPEAFPSVLHPGVTDLRQATVIDVRAGEEQGGMDLTLRRQRLYRIQGVVLDSTTGGAPPGTSLPIRLRYHNVVNGVAPDVGTTTDGRGTYQEGAFDFRGVPPGSYMLTAVQEGRTGYLPVEVTDRDVAGLVLRLSPAATLTGRWRSEDPAATADAFAQLRPAVRGFLGAVSAAFSTRRPDGTFIFNNVLPGEYHLVVTGLPTGFYVREARIGFIDALREPIRLEAGATVAVEIAVTAGAASVSGIVRDSSQNAFPGARVIVAPERLRDRPELFRDAVADQNGRFNLSSIPPGDYRLFAWESIEPFAWLDPQTLKQGESRSTFIRLSEMARETVEVPVIPSR